MILIVIINCFFIEILSSKLDKSQQAILLVPLDSGTLINTNQNSAVMPTN